MVAVKVKWNKESYDSVIVEAEKGVAHLKQTIYELTGVPADRQKLMAKGAWIGTLKDDAGDSCAPRSQIKFQTEVSFTFALSSYVSTDSSLLLLVQLSLHH